MTIPITLTKPIEIVWIVFFLLILISIDIKI